MNIIIDEKLRELRATRGNKQEDLANHIGISAQSVSKWERGEAMPDITFLPQIASYYDVTVDELLGVGEIKKQEKIHEYQMKNHKLGCDGKIYERVELWRKAYREFPNDLVVNEQLMQALYGTKDEKFYDEIVSLGERILHRSADESIRQNLQLMLDCLHHISSAEIRLCKNNDVDRELWHHEFCLKLLELYFDDGFYGIYAMHAAALHRIIAKIYLSHRKDEQKTTRHLRSAAKFAKQYDSLPDSFVYTSTLLNGYKNNRIYFKPYSETECETLLNFLCSSEFDIVRDKDWFKAIIEEL